MQINYILQRYWLDLKRHKLTIFISIPVFSALMILFGTIYPGPDAVKVFSEIPTVQFLIGTRNIQSPGMLIWFLIRANIFTIIFPVVGIFLGVRMLPFNERDGKELIFSTKISPIVYFIENFLIVMILIPVITLPNFLIAVLFLGKSSIDITTLTITNFLPIFFDIVVASFSNGTNMTSMAIANFLPVFFVMVVAMVTVFGASIKSSSKLGYAFGGIFYITSFTLDLVQPEISFVKNINLLSQIDLFDNVLNGTWNEGFIFTCLCIIGILFLLTILFLYRTDYIESRSGAVKASKREGKNFRSRFYFIRTPIETVLSKIGWKYPVFRDQLQNFVVIFILYAIVTSILVLVILIAYPGDKTMALLFTDMKSVLNNPLISSFMFGHTVEPNLEGFLLLKLMTFHWLYYGPYLFIATYYIVLRDKNEKYDEITWSLPHTRPKVILQRTIAMIAYFWLIVIINWIVLWAGVLVLTSITDVTAPSFGATIFAFTFLGLGYSLFLILFVTLALIPHPKYIWMILVVIFFSAILLPMLSVMYPNYSWIVYISPFKYFDVAGLLLNQVNILGTAIPLILIGGIVILVFYFTIITFWTPHRDIT